MNKLLHMAKDILEISKPSLKVSKEDIEASKNSTKNEGDAMLPTVTEESLTESEIKSISDSISTKKGKDYSANEVLVSSSKEKELKPLFPHLWYEKEISVLFSSSGLGKSILAVQMCDYIARHGYKVCYHDLELSPKQFQFRYTNGDGTLHKFSDNFYRPIISFSSLSSNEALIAEYIEAVKEKIKEGFTVFILDNIKYLFNGKLDRKGIVTFLKELKDLKEANNVSFLIIAHTPKRNSKKPLTLDDLAGCQELGAFVDSAFAIGKSLVEDKVVYIKQVKVRMGEAMYNEDNVLKCHITKEGTYTHFKPIGFEEESHLLNKKYKMDTENIERAWNLHQDGLSNRAISKELQVSEKTIGKWITYCEERKEFTEPSAFKIV